MQVMRYAVALGAVIGLGAGGGAVAAQDAVSEADYEAAMKELSYLANDASLHLEASYWGDLGEDTDKMRREFAKVETFWKAQEQPEAVDLLGRAVEAARAVARASGAQDRAAATSGLSDLRAACQACHAEFREETADGYRIKPSALKQ